MVDLTNAWPKEQLTIESLYHGSNSLKRQNVCAQWELDWGSLADLTKGYGVKPIFNTPLAKKTLKAQVI